MRVLLSSGGWGYIIRRILLAILVIWAAFTVTFIILFLVPGDPAQIIAGAGSGATPTPAQIAQIDKQYGLDQPPIVQYFVTLGHMLKGNLGTSYQYKLPVTTLISQNFPSTAALAAFALIWAIFFGLLIGGLTIFTRMRWLEKLFDQLPPLGASLPGFWVGLMLMQFFSFDIHLFPSSGDKGFMSVVLPAVTMAIPGAASIAQVFSKSLRNAYEEPFVEIAKAKGASRLRVFFFHGARNALLPVITVMGITVANLFVLSTVSETIFSRNGLGSMLERSVQTKDIPVVQGVVVLVAGIYVIANLIVDLVYPLIDARIGSGFRRSPRVRVSKQKVVMA